MARFSEELAGKYGVKTYQETKNTYDWILKSLQKGGFCDLKTDVNFLFKISQIMCSCTGIEEFSENAYGQEGYALNNFDIAAYADNIRLAFIYVAHNNSVSVSTDSKVLLEKIVKLLQETSLEETETSAPIPVTYIEQQNNNIAINGNDNIVATHHGSVTTSSEPIKSESKLKQWIISVGQNLLSNGIWYVLTLIAGAIVGVLVTK